MDVLFAAIPADRVDVLRRALDRARLAGAPAQLAVGSSAEGHADQDVQSADVVVSLPWPSTDGALAAALAAMAARKPVIVLETEASAGWPALDPQTWRPRGRDADPPIVVSLDPRDEEHSLMLAIQRLARDADLRTRLAAAAYDWSQRHPIPL